MSVLQHLTREHEVDQTPPATTPANAITNVLDARDSIWMDVFLQMGRVIAEAGLLIDASPSEQVLKDVAIEYPIDAIARLIEKVCEFPPGPRLEAALEAARGSARKYADEHLSTLAAPDSVDLLTSPVRLQELVEDLTTAEIDGFRSAMSAAEAA